MSHDHRDEQDLVTPVAEPPEPLVVVPVAPVVANSEAERRAAERRKAEGAVEQTTQHQFTGDLPEPDRGGTDTETHLRFIDGSDDDEVALATPPARSPYGPPSPRALHVEEEDSWVAAPTLDALGTGSLAIDSASWIGATRERRVDRLPARDSAWRKPS